LAIINTRVTTNESKRVGHAETETAQNLGIINTTEETIQEVENEIDIQKLLPAKPTEMNRFAKKCFIIWLMNSILCKRFLYKSQPKIV